MITNCNLDNIPEQPGIYCLTNTVNNKVYIGQSKNLKKRINAHFKKYSFPSSDGKHLYSAMRLYGPDKFFISILETLEPELSKDEISRQLNNLEVKYIAQYTSCNDGYNETNGAESTLGLNTTERCRKKISKALKNYYELHDNPGNKKTFGYNFIEGKSRAAVARILNEKGYNKVSSTAIVSVIKGRNNSLYDFVFGNSKEECLAKLKFFDTENAKYCAINRPDYNEYLNYLKTVVDKNGYLPKISEIAKQLGKTPGSISAYNNHIKEHIYLDKLSNRLKLKNFYNKHIDYEVKNKHKKYKIINIETNEEYLMSLYDISEFFNISYKASRTLVKRYKNTGNLYKKKYKIIMNVN